MELITQIHGEIVSDSRNMPTLAVSVETGKGKGTFSVPSGASTGVHEAYELRDDETGHGSVTRALEFLHTEITSAIVGMDVYDQAAIDECMKTLDGTSNKSRLGGNTLIGVSIATAKAAAASDGIPTWEYLHERFFEHRTVAFPRLYLNMINGGKHAKSPLAFQEYHVVPKTNVMADALALATRIQDALKSRIAKEYPSFTVGDEGGYALPIGDVTIPLRLFTEITTELGVRDQVEFALDVASSSFYDATTQTYKIDGTAHTIEDMNELYARLAAEYSLLSIEDPFSEDDFENFTALKSRIGATLRIGDDLTTTNIGRLERAIAKQSVDGLIIKPNQIGTLTETITTMEYAQEHGISCIISHRSGETTDDFIADLAYASGAFGIKAGARGPKEREAKYARLVGIETSLLSK